MQWADVNLKRGEWLIKETKNGTPQTVTLSPEALKVSYATKYVIESRQNPPHSFFPKMVEEWASN